MEGFFGHYATRSGSDSSDSVGNINRRFVVKENDAHNQEFLSRSLEKRDEGYITRGIADRFLNPLRRIFDRMRQFTRELVVAGALAFKGPDLDADDIAALDQSAAAQVEYLNRFQREIETNPPPEIAAPIGPGFPSTTIIVQQPPMTPKQIIARAQSYGHSVWPAAQQMGRTAGVTAGIMSQERRVLGHPKTHHCDDCPPLAALGWQPIGTLPHIGQSECGGMCYCHFEYRTGPDAKATKSPTKPPRPTRPKGGGRKPDLPSNEAGGSLIPGESTKPPIKIKPIGPPSEPPLSATELEELHFKLPPGYEWSS